ncbi:hypothetical protein BDN70DRAFT_806377 [Pholiota conissans]|uniref:F-box domain-containing protein n=1 Tax=Pholiota conissans TaxID=109636 RepID=A0A9P5Z1S0_9AGAR|nr:hypothetical protein BDN70DRAFT_806377 [Pholiota conissans]
MTGLSPPTRLRLVEETGKKRRYPSNLAFFHGESTVHQEENCIQKIGDKNSATQLLKGSSSSQGVLRKMVEMPMDMLFEIISHLDPLDLLHLAQTAKPLRSVLMKCSSRCVWKSAFSNVVGLPKCPDDLNEPQYATLMFVNICSTFTPAYNIHVSWYARLRACNDCLRSAKYVH